MVSAPPLSSPQLTDDMSSSSSFFFLSTKQSVPGSKYVLSHSPIHLYHTFYIHFRTHLRRFLPILVSKSTEPCILSRELTNWYIKNAG